jgi:hypothetical protein
MMKDEKDGPDGEEPGKSGERWTDGQRLRRRLLQLGEEWELEWEWGVLLLLLLLSMA